MMSYWGWGGGGASTSKFVTVALGLVEDPVRVVFDTETPHVHQADIRNRQGLASWDSTAIAQLGVEQPADHGEALS